MVFCFKFYKKFAKIVQSCHLLLFTLFSPFLTFYISMVCLSKLTSSNSVWFFKLNSIHYSDFTNSHQVFVFCSRILPRILLYLLSWVLSNDSFSDTAYFLWPDSLRSTGQVFCIMLLNLDLFDVFPIIMFAGPWVSGGETT